MLNNETDELPVVTVMIGISCSGKSTYANGQCDAMENVVNLEEDAFYTAICGWDKRDAEEQLEKQKFDRITSLVNGIMKKSLSAAVAAGFDVIWDTTMIKRTQLRKLIHTLDDTIGDGNYQLRFVLSKTETPECQLAYQEKYRTTWEQTYHLHAEEHLINQLVTFIQRHYRNQVYYQ